MKIIIVKLLFGAINEHINVAIARKCNIPKRIKYFG
jgi:hypothetical protein